MNECEDCEFCRKRDEAQRRMVRELLARQPGHITITETDIDETYPNLLN